MKNAIEIEEDSKETWKMGSEVARSLVERRRKYAWAGMHENLTLIININQ